ncbi:MAG: S8 family serine peptidase [Pseudoxanthomonas sp.]
MTKRAKSDGNALMPAGVSLEGFWVHLGSASLSTHQQIAKSLAACVGSKANQVKLLPEAAGTRPREVLLLTQPGAWTSSAACWDTVRTLQQQIGVLDAEPLFASPGVEPAPEVQHEWLSIEERPKPVAKSGGDKRPLPCAASNAQWHLEAVFAPEAWLLKPPAGGLRQGEGIVIGHPDTGYTHHPEIWDPTPATRRVLPDLGYNFKEGKKDPADLMNGSFPGHGTGTASVIMSPPGGPGASFVTGTAPMAKIVPIRVSDSVIHFSFANTTQAIYHAVDVAGAHVISMSLGGPFKSRALESAIAYAISQGVIVLAAAGNVWPWVVYPARFESVIALAATNCQSKPWSDSASGSAVDLSAPGESVWRARAVQANNGLKATVEPGSGTSFAVATTAGACASWLAFHGRDALIARYGKPNLAAVFRSLLVQAVNTPSSGWDKSNYGTGILDMRQLLNAPLPSLPKKLAKKSPAIVQHSQIDALKGYFPDIPGKKAAAGASKFAKRVPKGVTAKTDTRTDFDEFLFHVATNPKLRSVLRADWSGKVKKKAGSADVTSIAAKTLHDPSRALLAWLGK